ncbi:MAG: L-fuculose-phosphate aldolase [Fusobacterium sp. JB021]|nr:L-fuculose-phosphate aldolase [Fusobacterium sp. JB020]MDP0493413.1 L-fuculose-phosphate aldolase [Fusobacterium sp. JB021]MDP0507647.1 L-fuculose-phosphate aldolase [Fusobacterium sp. JB019]
MLLEKERIELMNYGKRMITEGLTKGTGGNLSICNREKNLMAVTPSGVGYLEIVPEDIVILDVDTGDIVEGDRVPSSESDMHRIFYKYRKDINAMVHTHSKYSAGLSCTGNKLPAIHYLLAVAGVDVPCAKYATYGTVKLAKTAYEAMKDTKAVLLSNHGLLTGGKNLGEAYNIAENVEFCCELYFISKVMGKPFILEEKEMKNVIERFKDYGERIEEHEKI